MKTLEILVTGTPYVDFAPSSTAQEVAQNIRTIISTPKYSVPLARDFGLDETITDSPVNRASAKISSDIIMAVRKYEPRAKITDIDFVNDSDGKLGVKVKFSLKD